MLGNCSVPVGTRLSFHYDLLNATYYIGQRVAVTVTSAVKASVNNVYAKSTFNRISIKIRVLIKAPYQRLVRRLLHSMQDSPCSWSKSQRYFT